MSTLENEYQNKKEEESRFEPTPRWVLLDPDLRGQQKKMRPNVKAERYFLMFKDQLAESGRQKSKENIIPRGKFRPVENDPNASSTARPRRLMAGFTLANLETSVKVSIVIINFDKGKSVRRC